jgi:hypothetical protein
MEGLGSPQWPGDNAGRCAVTSYPTPPNPLEFHTRDCYVFQVPSARSQTESGKVLRTAAQTYKVDTDAIALKVKQEFAAKGDNVESVNSPLDILHIYALYR